ncbi:hypothetical protein [Variovorax paradoxus]|uniref:DUF4440 domain-containing protein n=1 Tax=Variovorax paradoxus TaxID=34073 RepID=A0A0H2LVA7_VARPD|nr:hypothetical protein [Variovorax paradoxus]KLN54188.1 hypothetical protein VPARA_47560 [Variovorax paradoxus]
MTDFANFVAPAASGSAAEADAIHEASACLDRFTERFNARDTAGMDGELHFPHVMLSGADRLEWRAPGNHPADFFGKLEASGWRRTRYQSKEAVLASADKVHFVVTYTREDAAGTVLSTHRNLWIATRVDGRWGISLRSY